MVYRVAEEHERITTNPASSVKQKRENNGRVCYITPAQEESLRRVMDNDHLLEFEIGLMTGMRLSEQFELTWDRVDIDAGLIRLVDTKAGEWSICAAK